MLQLPPLDFTDVILLLIIGGILLIITAELPSLYGSTSLARNKKRLMNAAIATGILFLATAAVRIIGIIIGA